MSDHGEAQRWKTRADELEAIVRATVARAPSVYGGNDDREWTECGYCD